LAAAGISDRAMVIRYQGIRGTMHYASFHTAADWTTIENTSTPARNGRYERLEDEPFFGSSDRPDFSQGEAQHVGGTGSAGMSIPLKISATVFEGPDKCDIGLCAGCGRLIEGKRAGARTCSAACRKRVSRGATWKDAAE
jgi:hypothetical protein